jgi:hypothetical protein
MARSRTTLDPVDSPPTRHREFATGLITARPDAVFDLITDPARLPEWNDVITDVVDAPAKLEVGSVWRVRFRVLGQTWVSRSQVTDINPLNGTFAYRSQTDDGNPSSAEWRWHVRPDHLSTNRDRTAVTVGVSLHPLTYWRSHLLVKVRRPLLRSEMHRSLTALGRVSQMYIPPLTPMTWPVM